MTTNIALQAHNIEKTLGSGAAAVQALKGVSIALETGKLTLLRGPSGSGKTTLMSILGGILKPATGTVELAGQDLSQCDEEALAAIRREYIGFVFQSYNLFPSLTALQNVMLAFAIKARSGGNATEKAKAALAAVGLAHKYSSYPAHLSGGEQQRVAIARAIVCDPLVLLADEPTAALDGQNGRTAITILARLATELPCAVLVVTHDERINCFADRMITMEDGLITGDLICVPSAVLRAFSEGVVNG